MNFFTFVNLYNRIMEVEKENNKKISQQNDINRPQGLNPSQQMP